MTTGLYESALSLQGDEAGRATRDRALRIFPPIRPGRRDPPLLVELFRCTDTAAAVLLLVAQLLLLAAIADGQGLSGLFRRPVRLIDILAVSGFAGWWYLSFVALGMYAPHRLMRVSDEAVAVTVAAALGSVPLFPVVLLFPTTIGPGHALAFWLAAAVLVFGMRILLRRLGRRLRPMTARRVLIVGSGPRARTLLTELRRGARGDATVVGHLDSGAGRENLSVPFLGELDDLERILMETAVDAVVIALPIKSCYGEVQRTIEVCEHMGVVAQYPADVFQSARTEPWLDPTGERAVVALGPLHDDGRRRVKRALDILGASVGLILLAPLMILIALAIRLTGPGPVLFVQQRCGRNRRCFPMYKFRTMVSNAEALQAALEHLNEAPGPVFKIRRDPRVTRLGRLLRRTSLDELPQLVNVLCGDMSLVGPRPLPLRDVYRFSAAASLRRFSVRPGMTCLWQVNGRCDIPFDDWIDLDLQYIDRWSLLLDLRILLRTVPAVLRGEGAV